MTGINKDLALKIAKKLGAEIKAGKKHDIAQVYHAGKMIAMFGIRRGSDKDLCHDHVPQQIHMPASKARLLGLCPMSKNEWLQVLTERGLI